MKLTTQAIALAILAMSSTMVFANEAAPAAATPKAEAPKQERKMAHKEARKECLKENPALKGKELHACVKGKLGK